MILNLLKMPLVQMLLVLGLVTGYLQIRYNRLNNRLEQSQTELQKFKEKQAGVDRQQVVDWARTLGANNRDLIGLVTRMDSIAMSTAKKYDQPKSDKLKQTADEWLLHYHQHR